MHFLAQVYFKIESALQEKEQFDCQLRLIQAENREEALFIIRETALQEEISFVNENNQTVHWKFAGVTHLYPIDIMKQGAEIHSSTIESLKIEQYDKYISIKNNDLALEIGKNELIFSL